MKIQNFLYISQSWPRPAGTSGSYGKRERGGGGTHLEVDPSLDEVHLEDLVDVGEAAELALHVLLDEAVVRRLRRTLDRHEVEVLDARRRDELLRHTHGRARGGGAGRGKFGMPARCRHNMARRSRMQIVLLWSCKYDDVVVSRCDKQRFNDTDPRRASQVTVGMLAYRCCDDS